MNLRIQPDQSLEDLAARTGGRVLSDVADFWATPVSPATSRLALRPTLLWRRLCCLVLDIALRKLPWEEALPALVRRRGVREEQPRAPRPSTKPASDRHRAKSDERPAPRRMRRTPPTHCSPQGGTKAKMM